MFLFWLQIFLCCVPLVCRMHLLLFVSWHLACPRVVKRVCLCVCVFSRTCFYGCLWVVIGIACVWKRLVQKSRSERCRRMHRSILVPLQSKRQRMARANFNARYSKCNRVQSFGAVHACACASLYGSGCWGICVFVCLRVCVCLCVRASMCARRVWVVLAKRVCCMMQCFGFAGDMSFDAKQHWVPVYLTCVLKYMPFLYTSSMSE